MEDLLGLLLIACAVGVGLSSAVLVCFGIWWATGGIWSPNVANLARIWAMADGVCLFTGGAIWNLAWLADRE